MSRRQQENLLTTSLAPIPQSRSKSKAKLKSYCKREPKSSSNLKAKSKPESKSIKTDLILNLSEVNGLEKLTKRL